LLLYIKLNFQEGDTQNLFKKKSKLVKKHRKLYRRSISRKVKQIKRVKRIEKRCFGLYAHLKSVSLKTRRQKELTLSKLKSLQKFKTQEKAWKKIQTQKLRKYRSVQRDVARKELDALTKRYKEKESKEKFEVQTRQKNILKDIETLKEQVGKSVEVENKARKIYNDVEVVYKRYRASFINEKKKLKRENKESRNRRRKFKQNKRSKRQRKFYKVQKIMEKNDKKKVLQRKEGLI